MTARVEKAECATLTVDEAAKWLGISRNSAYAGVRTGDIPAVRIGGRVLVSRAALKRLLNETGGRVTANAPSRGVPE